MSRIAKFLMLIALAALFTGAVFAEANSANIPKGYEKIAENSAFNLYLMRENLSLAVESKASGNVLHSTVQDTTGLKDNAQWSGFYRSGVVMEYIEGLKSSNTQADFVNSAHELTYDFTENGFTAHVKFTDIGISFDVNVEMDETGFVVTIPQDSITEEMSEKYTVATFTVFPFLGHSRLGSDEGYMIIPDGQGAIIELKDNEGRFTSPYDEPVYGTNIGIEDSVYSVWSVDTEPVIMPVFGAVHTDKEIGFLGYIEEGDNAARIMAYPNGVRTSFDWVGARYTYRWVYQQPTGPSSGTVSMRTEKVRDFDIVQRFFLTDGEEATYAGLAKAWREYMTEKGVFENADDRPYDVEIDFIGLEKENYILGKRDVVMTDFEEATAILNDLNDNGVDHLSVVYRGWLSDGLTGSLPTDDYSPAKALGGKDGFEAFMENAKKRGMIVSLEADFLTMNPDVHPTYVYNALKKMTSQTFRKPSFGMVYDTVHYMNPAKSREIANSVVDKMAKGGVEGISVTGITQLMSDFYYQNHYRDSVEMMGTYSEIAKYAGENMKATLQSANHYLWKYAGAISDMPVGGSDYTYTQREIPLLAIALSGKIPYYVEYVNFQANNQEFFLHLVEQGARACFLITEEDPIELQNTNSANIYSSRFELYRENIISWYKELKALNDLVRDASILRHDQEGNMVKVTWDNGVKVYLNFGDNGSEMDGVSLDGMTYKVVNENGR